MGILGSPAKRAYSDMTAENSLKNFAHRTPARSCRREEAEIVRMKENPPRHLGGYKQKIDGEERRFFRVTAAFPNPLPARASRGEGDPPQNVPDGDAEGHRRSYSARTMRPCAWTGDDSVNSK